MKSGIYEYIREPEISQASVKLALRGIRYSPTSTGTSELESLLLVDLLLRSPDIPVSRRNRTLALQHILIDLIVATYSLYRERLGFSAPDMNAVKAQVATQIKHDLRTENVELIAWGWLYHLYVRIDLDLGFTEFWKFGGFDETQRRYQRHALRRLAEQLHDREWQARRLHRKRHLYLKLPAMPDPVFGRDEVFSELQRTIDIAFPVVIQVTGDKGIGKTALVRELLRRQSKAEKLDDILWLRQPYSVAQVELEVCAQLGVVSLDTANEIAGDYRIALVLDDIRHLEDPLRALNALLHALPHFKIYLTHRRYLSLSVPAHHTLLKGISFEATRQLTHYLHMAQQGPVLSPGEVETIWNSAVGNPGRIKDELQRFAEPESDSA